MSAHHYNLDPTKLEVILMCDGGRITGGSEKIAITSALELRRRGVRVGFVTADKDPDPILAEAGVELCIIEETSYFDEPDRKRMIQKLVGNHWVVQPIRDFLRKFDAKKAVVHIHNVNLILSFKATEAAQDMGFRTVQSCHEYSTACPTSLFYDYRKEHLCTLKPLGAACWTTPCLEAGPKVRIPRLTAHWAAMRSGVYDRMSAFLYVSSHSMKRLLPHHPSSALKELLPYPLPGRAKTLAEAHNNKNYLYIGRFTTEKAPRDFAIAAKQAGVPAVFIGGGPLEASLKADFPEHRFTGWLNKEQIEAELLQARCYVIPSRWEETFGLSVADAIAFGVPVIASNVVGAIDVVQVTGAGISYGPGEISGLVQAIRALEGERGTDIFRKARYAADFNSDITVHHDQLLGIYERVLALPVPG